MKPTDEAIFKINNFINQYGTGSNLEVFSDTCMVNACAKEMSERLYDSREKGRHGWWNDSVCSINDLKDMRDKAISDGDHVSVLNFTGMIMLRESMKG